MGRDGTTLSLKRWTGKFDAKKRKGNRLLSSSKRWTGKVDAKKRKGNRLLPSSKSTEPKNEALSKKNNVRSETNHDVCVVDPSFPSPEAAKTLSSACVSTPAPKAISNDEFNRQISLLRHVSSFLKERDAKWLDEEDSPATVTTAPISPKNVETPDKLEASMNSSPKTNDSVLPRTLTYESCCDSSFKAIPDKNPSISAELPPPKRKLKWKEEFHSDLSKCIDKSWRTDNAKTKEEGNEFSSDRKSSDKSRRTDGASTCAARRHWECTACLSKFATRKEALKHTETCGLNDTFDTSLTIKRKEESHSDLSKCINKSRRTDDASTRARNWKCTLCLTKFATRKEALKHIETCRLNETHDTSLTTYDATLDSISFDDGHDDDDDQSESACCLRLEEECEAQRSLFGDLLLQMNKLTCGCVCAAPESPSR